MSKREMKKTAQTSQQTIKAADELPAKLAAPARRALIQAGYTQLEQLSQLTETELLQLHGMGPKAISQLREALTAAGKSFAQALPTTKKEIPCIQ